MIHVEGGKYLLGRTFPIAGSFGTFRQWRMGLTGLPCTGAGATPAGYLAGEILLNVYTDHYAITHPLAYEGGAVSAPYSNSENHRQILGYSRSAPFSFVVQFHCRSTAFGTPGVFGFGNRIDWVPLPGAGQPSDWRQPGWEPVHGYPWSDPVWDFERFQNEYSAADGWTSMMTGSPHTAANFPVGAAFVVDTDDTMLLCTTRFGECVQIRPGGTLFAGYRGWLEPRACTAEFLRRVALRAFTNDAQYLAANWRAVLVRNEPGSITWSSSAANLLELSASTSSGYAPKAFSSWAFDTALHTVKGTLPSFTNTGAVPWETAHYLCVLADYSDVGAVLAFWQQLVPPIALSAGESLSFPQGFKWRLAA